MFRIITLSGVIALSTLCQLATAEVVDESWRQVFEFQSKMAAQGNNKAQFTLGEMYQNGRGVVKDYDTAIEWYTKAKSNGHDGAADRIAMIYQSKKQEAEARQKAEAEKAAQKERARQQALAQEREADAKRKKQAREKKQAAKAKKQAQKQKTAQTKLTPEERAKKIKEAQERAKAIAKENELKQQQKADAALEEYKRSLASTKSAEAPKKQPAKVPEKYIDPFE